MKPSFVLSVLVQRTIVVFRFTAWLDQRMQLIFYCSQRREEATEGPNNIFRVGRRRPLNRVCLNHFRGDVAAQVEGFYYGEWHRCSESSFPTRKDV